MTEREIYFSSYHNWPYKFGIKPDCTYNSKPAGMKNDKGEYLFWHHIIPVHFCKILIRNDEWTKFEMHAKENGMWLTREEHKIVHEFLYEQTGHIYDKKAINGSSNHDGWTDEDQRIFNSEHGKRSSGTTGYKHTQETLDFLSERFSGKNNPNSGGVCQTLEVRKVMRDKKIGEKNNQFGKHWFTDGVNDIVCFEKDKLEGWWRGRSKPFGEGS